MDLKSLHPSVGAASHSGSSLVAGWNPQASQWVKVPPAVRIVDDERARLRFGGCPTSCSAPCIHAKTAWHDPECTLAWGQGRLSSSAVGENGLASPAADPSAIADRPRMDTKEVRERADQNEECKDDERRHANLTSFLDRCSSH